jgi:hypothetical protein
VTVVGAVATVGADAAPVLLLLVLLVLVLLILIVFVLRFTGGFLCCRGRRGRRRWTGCGGGRKVGSQSGSAGEDAVRLVDGDLPASRAATVSQTSASRAVRAVP